MLVLFDHQIFNLQQRGGVSRYYVALANHLSAEEGLDVSVPALLHINHFLAQSRHGGWPNFRASAFAHLGRFPYRVNRLQTRAAVLVNKPDIFHATYFQPDRYVMKHSRRFAITIYDMIHEKFPEAFPKDDLTVAWKHRLAVRADLIFCISQCTRNDLLTIYPEIEPSKVHVTPLGFDSPISKQSDFPPIDQPYLLYVGARTPHKNFRKLLEAYCTSTDLQREFKLVCFGGGILTREELDLTRTFGGNPDHLIWTEGGDDLLARFYRHAATFVMPSLYEGFGLPILEAMSNDCPVCCSNAGSLPEVAGDAALYFDPRDTEQICSAIRQVVDDSSLREKLLQRGHRRLDAFSWSQCSEATYKAYQRIV